MGLSVKSVLLPLLLATVFSSGARAQPEIGVREAVEFCLGLEGDANRLRCIEEMAETAGWSAKPAAVFSSDDSNKEQPSLAADDQIAPSEQAIASKDDEKTAQPYFRLNTEDAKSSQKQKREVFESVVVTAWRNPLGKAMTVLENGEIWQQNDVDRKPLPEVGETVTFSPAMLGSWKMKYKNVKAVRVRMISSD